MGLVYSQMSNENQRAYSVRRRIVTSFHARAPKHTRFSVGVAVAEAILCVVGLERVQQGQEIISLEEEDMIMHLLESGSLLED